MSSQIKRTVGFVALGGFIISLTVHALTYVGIDTATYFPPIWALHLGIFVVFVPFVITVQPIQRANSRNPIRAVFANVPLWAKVILGMIFVYAIINFMLFMGLSEGGSPSIENGRFILQSHGTFIRELTESEYNWQLAYITRGFSGHWLLFYAVPAVYFLFQPQPALK
jgi:hypothetical protein